MPVTIRPSCRFPIQCLVIYNAGVFLKRLLAYYSLFGLVRKADQHWPDMMKQIAA